MPNPTFHVALNMAGAVSAGAYTAGVVDFLIDALDHWYAERDRQRQQHGEDFANWEIPVHEVQIPVLSGASAGGMTSAIAAASFYETFSPVRSIPTDVPADNKLYKSWVADIDIDSLVSDSDLKGGAVTSVLNSSKLEQIAKEALTIKPLAAKRAWVADRLRLILTLTNLRGVPYTIEQNSQDATMETQSFYYADQMQFEVGSSAESAPHWIPLQPNQPANWDLLQLAALGTGAVPIMLAPREIPRSAGDYNHRLWNVPVEDPETLRRCEQQIEVKPNWDLSDNSTMATLNVDGGVTNNNPFECARRELARLPGATGERSPEKVDRAVITIAPFPSVAKFDPKFDSERSLLQTLGGLLNTLLTQSRFQGESLTLAKDPRIFNSFVIAPSNTDADKDMPVLACGSVQAFGGFLSKSFRDHDYQMGRRNCQRFLMKHLVLPEDNPIMQQGLPQGEELRKKVLSLYGVPSQIPGDGRTWMPVIPLVSELQAPLPKPARPTITGDQLDDLVERCTGRIKNVLHAVLRQRDGWLKGNVEFEGLWLLAGGKIKSEMKQYMEADLKLYRLLS